MIDLKKINDEKNNPYQPNRFYRRNYVVLS